MPAPPPSSLSRSAPQTREVLTRPSKDKAPVIGLTMRVRPEGGESSHHIRPFYAESVIEAGGVPVYLPVTRDENTLRRYVLLADGLALTGDADLPPEAYGEKPAPQTRPIPRERYEYERRLIELYLETDKPLLGICLGCQFVNVVLGGSLIQDIPSLAPTAITHREQEQSEDARHAITPAPDTLLRELLGERPVTVKSSHHQAVKKVGKGLRVAARAEDGVIEALEMTGGRWGLLVQWHPERMEGTEHRRILFGAFIQACRDRVRGLHTRNAGPAASASGPKSCVPPAF